MVMVFHLLKKYSHKLALFAQVELILFKGI